MGSATTCSCGEIRSTEPLDLMRGFDGDGPTRPFGGTEELAISLDGNEVAFAAKVMTRDAAWSRLGPPAAADGWWPFERWRYRFPDGRVETYEFAHGILRRAVRA